MPETMRAIRLTGPVDIDGLTVSDVPRSTKPPPTCSRRSASRDPGRRRPRTPEPVEIEKNGCGARRFDPRRELTPELEKSRLRRKDTGRVQSSVHASSLFNRRP